MKKKKVTKKQKPIGRKQKIDVVIESLVHLEQKVKELIEKVENLERQSISFYESEGHNKIDFSTKTLGK